MSIIVVQRQEGVFTFFGSLVPLFLPSKCVEGFEEMNKDVEIGCP